MDNFTRAQVVKAIMNNDSVGLSEAVRIEKTLTDAERKEYVETYCRYGGRF